MALAAGLHKELDELIMNHHVVLFMKGTRQSPRCGFSARVVGILDEFLDDYETIDVLSRPDIWEGIKEYTNWPTIPQLYVGSKFVGGSDIVQEMLASGELHKTLGIEPPDVEEPRITITDSAAKALREAMPQVGEKVVRLSITKRFQHEMSGGPRREGDFTVESNGIIVLIDRLSAARADGLTIDYVTMDPNAGFTMDNPNEPRKG